jgi:hypothetical protein
MRVLRTITILLLVLVGAVLWLYRVPEWLITERWPVETYYAVRAELELDGRIHVLEATGVCEWRWNPRSPITPGGLRFAAAS